MSQENTRCGPSQSFATRVSDVSVLLDLGPLIVAGQHAVGDLYTEKSSSPHGYVDETAKANHGPMPSPLSTTVNQDNVEESDRLWVLEQTVQ